MATVIAFLRAINLGKVRKFPAAAVKSATESIGATDVETWLNTGNVRLTTSLRRREKIEAALEAAYREATGFDVPTIVVTPAEIVAAAAECERLASLHPQLGMQYVSLLKQEPDPQAVTDLMQKWSGPDRVVFQGRRAHLLLGQRDSYHSSSLSNATIEKVFGVATNRNANVIATLAQKWCS